MLREADANILYQRKLNGLKLEVVTSFKYSGVTLCEDGTFSAEIWIRIASAVPAMARLIRIWWYNTFSFTSKFKLYRSLVTPILFYGCETWNLLVDFESRICAFKIRCLRILLSLYIYISYFEHKANDWVRNKISFLVGPQDPLQQS